jgi:membrane-associated protein
MHTFIEFFQHLHSLDELISWGGLLVLVIIVFAETGLLVGFFLPGDSLLITAGLFAARPDSHLRIGTLLVALSAAAIIGQGVGYWIGYKAGPPLFSRPNSRLFKQEHLQKAHAFYEKHGGMTIVLARFMPIVRTFVPVVAGVARMPYRAFMLYNIVGGIAWVFSMCLIGYFLGGHIPGIERHIDKVIAVVIFLSILPMLVHAYKGRAKARKPTAVPVEAPASREP